MWIKNGTEILYSQETHITFWCPMRFGKYPLDRQVTTLGHFITYNHQKELVDSRVEI